MWSTNLDLERYVYERLLELLANLESNGKDEPRAGFIYLL